jgi:predicted GIY-YIG superfamily endonuclease
MQYTVYIIYNATIDQFYIGQTCNLEKKILEHNSAIFHDSLASKNANCALIFNKIHLFKNRIHFYNFKRKNCHDK